MLFSINFLSCLPRGCYSYSSQGTRKMSIYQPVLHTESQYQMKFIYLWLYQKGNTMCFEKERNKSRNCFKTSHADCSSEHSNHIFDRLPFLVSLQSTCISSVMGCCLPLKILAQHIQSFFSSPPLSKLPEHFNIGAKRDFTILICSPCNVYFQSLFKERLCT